MNKNKTKAFTLVELIVVITILAILGTIAFISLESYTREARDSKRLSDINNIQKKISIELVKGTNLTSLINLVKENSGLTINSASGTSIQGTANFQTLKEDGNKFKDPITKGDYVVSYSVGGVGTGAYKFTQISTINEENNQAVVNGNYYLMQVGDSESIIKNDTNNFVVDEGLDLPYLVVSGGTTANTNRYPGCDTDDITVGSYTISACNVGATIAGTGSDSYGSYFQWGRNKGFAYGDTTEQTTTISGSEGLNPSDSYGFVSGTEISGLWTEDVISDNWGGITNTNIAKQGPCYTGYHIPSKDEWVGLISSLGFLNGNELNNNLLIPSSGRRQYSTQEYWDQDNYGYYWSSTQASSTRGYYLDFSPSSITPDDDRSMAFGFSVRCMKN